MSSIETPDVVVIGGGIAGCVFSTVMARAGHSVLMLEITEQHRDVVRGEWLAPWGVIEAQRLGLYDLYRSRGAHHLKRTSAATRMSTARSRKRGRWCSRRWGRADSGRLPSGIRASAVFWTMQRSPAARVSCAACARRT
jgi:choline dehydrogenase-like flavoprotein